MLSGARLRLPEGHGTRLPQHSRAERGQLSDGVSDRDDCEAVEGDLVDR